MIGTSVDAWLAIFKAVYLWSLIVAIGAAVMMAGSGFFIITWQQDAQRRRDAEVEHYTADVSATVAQARSGESAMAQATAARERAAQREKAARAAEPDAERQTQQIAPRHLKRAQAEQLIGFLETHPFTLPVVVLPNDREAAGYARDIVNALSAAGMTIIRTPLYSEARTGLILSGQRTAQYKALLDAFELADIPVVEGPIETEFPPEHWMISLTIGSRI